MIEEPTRAEHLAWCKRRALELCDGGDLKGAYFSLVSDLGKHSQTRNHLGLNLGTLMLLGGHLSTAPQMRAFIEGFN